MTANVLAPPLQDEAYRFSEMSVPTYTSSTSQGVGRRDKAETFFSSWLTTSAWLPDSSKSMLAAGALFSFAIGFDILVPMFWQFLQVHCVMSQDTPRAKQSQYFLRHLRRTTREGDETRQLRANGTNQAWILSELTCSSYTSSPRRFSSDEE